MMTLQQLLSHTRKAVDTFSMIEDGDRIAIGVSGGKDSLTLALALKGLQRFYPKHFELQAFTVSLGFPGTDFSPVADFMAAHDIPYQVIESDIGEIVFEQRKEKNPCALCAKMRKGAFNDAAKAAGCNKVALGHHKEDAVETFLMSLLYEGRINTFSPVTHWDRIGLYSIRPLLFVSEQDIVYFANQNHLPIVKNPCPANGFTKREEAKQQLRQWNQRQHGTTDRIFRAILDSSIKGWDVHDLPR